MSSNSLSFTFRPLTRQDFPLLSEWLARPHVARWWQHDPTTVEEDFGVVVDKTDPGEVFIVLLDLKEIGLIQRYRFGDNPQWLSAFSMLDISPLTIGIDYFIAAADHLGRGLGTAMIHAFVQEIWRTYPETPAIVVDVDQENIASWRALEKSGFSKIWAGTIESDDPTEKEPLFVLELRSPYSRTDTDTRASTTVDPSKIPVYTAS